MLEVLSVESPIEKEYLFRKVLKSYGISKLGARLNRILEYLLSDLQSNHPTEVYVYDNTISLQAINGYCEVRISTEKQRPFVFVPKEELGGAVVSILQSSFSISRSALIKDVASEIFHNKKTGSKIVKKMNTVINYLISIDIVKQEDGVIRLTNKVPVFNKTTTLKEELSPNNRCPACNSSNYEKKGFRNNKQRYICIDCKRNWTSDGIVRREAVNIVTRKKGFQRENTLEEIVNYLNAQESENSPLRFWYRDDIEHRNIHDYYLDEKYINVRSEKGYYIKFLIDRIRKI
ncbi:hypothetical protein ACFL2C_01270 [Patescibacteria group bacterium]